LYERVQARASSRSGSMYTKMALPGYTMLTSTPSASMSATWAAPS
jgi:hypothetical protein